MRSALGGRYSRAWKRPVREKKEKTMKKTIVMRLEPAKETPGCYRYMRDAGDRGVETIYLRKADVEGPPPAEITMTLKGD